jgi:acetyl esterase/lipase
MPGDAPRAAMVICPGGAYRFHAPHEAEPVARWLQQLGIAALVLRYRVAPYRHPIPLLDIQRAIRVSRYRAPQWTIDPRRIGVMGFSAGGHVASMAGTHFDGGAPDSDDPIERESCRPDAVVLGYPVITFGELGHAESIANLLGGRASPRQRNELSSDLHVSESTPPTFLWHTADDAVVPVGNSLLFASALSQHAVPFALHVFDSGGHGLGLATEHARVRRWTALCASWLVTCGFGVGPPPQEHRTRFSLRSFVARLYWNFRGRR